MFLKKLKSCENDELLRKKAFLADFAKAQGEMGTIITVCKKPNSRRVVSDLEGVWGACHKVLNEHGITVEQPLTIGEFCDGFSEVKIQTKILHIDGYSESSDITMNLPIEELEESIIYLKRLSFSCSLGLPYGDEAVDFS